MSDPRTSSQKYERQHAVLIDGNRFSTFEGFVTEFNRAYSAVFPGLWWDGEDFNDLDDLLEAPDCRLCIRWANSTKSRTDLGYEATVRFWQRRLEECRATFPKVTTLLQNAQERIDQAQAGQGETLFHWLVDAWGTRSMSISGFSNP